MDPFTFVLGGLVGAALIHAFRPQPQPQPQQAKAPRTSRALGAEDQALLNNASDGFLPWFDGKLTLNAERVGALDVVAEAERLMSDRAGEFKDALRHIPFGVEAVALWYSMVDSDTPVLVKVNIAQALLYLVSPVDLIPEAIAGPLGFADDALDVGQAFYVAYQYIKPQHLAKAKRWLGMQGLPSQQQLDPGRTSQQDKEALERQIQSLQLAQSALVPVPFAVETLALYYLMIDPATPTSAKLPLARTLAWLASSFDLIPEGVMGQVGKIDDAAVLAKAWMDVYDMVRPTHVSKAQAWLSRHGVKASVVLTPEKMKSLKAWTPSMVIR